MFIPFKIYLSFSAFHNRRASQQKENEVAQGQEQERLISTASILVPILVQFFRVVRQHSPSFLLFLVCQSMEEFDFLRLNH